MSRHQRFFVSRVLACRALLPGRLLALALWACLSGPSVALAQIPLSGAVVFTDDTSAPPGGVELPGTPTELETVHYAFPLANTFQNGCYASSYAGDSTVSIDVATRTVAVDFDESTADYAPICPAVFDPVSNARIDLDALPAGEWTLYVDAVYDGPLPIFNVVPAQTIGFTVVAAAPVPSMGAGAAAFLLAGLLAVVVDSFARVASEERRGWRPRRPVEAQSSGC